MSIFTNKLSIQFNIKAIEKDFVFIRFVRKTSQNWLGAPQLDQLLGNDYKATSVMFQYGKYAYAMFNNPVNAYELISQLRKNKDFMDEEICEVYPRESFDESNDSICGSWLVQILLNSLSSSRSRFTQYHFSNLTGALLLVPDLTNKFPNALDVAKVTISNSYLLNISMVRYRKRISVLAELKSSKSSERKKILSNALKKPNYVFESATRTLKRQLSSNDKVDNKKSYIEVGVYKKKVSIPFLDVKGITSFNQSRAGIIYQVLNSIQTLLSKYLTVEPVVLEIEESIQLNNKIFEKPKQLQPHIDNQPIRIVDRVSNHDSKVLSNLLKKSLISYVVDNKNISQGKRDKEECINLRIIHDKSYYKNKDLKDEYLPSSSKYQRQHLTIETNASTSKSAFPKIVKTIIKELLIKRDISSKQLNLFDWGKVNATQDWIFATCDKKNKSCTFMTISPDGSFKLHDIDGTSLFGHSEYQEYIDLIEEYNSKNWQTGLTVEGLVISEDKDINLILRSDEISLPDLGKIMSIVEEFEADLPKNLQTGDDLSKVVEQFTRSHPELKHEKLTLLLSALKDIGTQSITKKSFTNLSAEYLGSKRKVDGKLATYVNNTSEATKLRDHLLENYNIRLKFPQDNESKDDLFDGSLNIKYFGETKLEANYFVGGSRESVQSSFKDACHIRKIIAVNNTGLIFKQLLATLDVDFVRTGQSTVLPFPFKYIREYKYFKE